MSTWQDYLHIVTDPAHVFAELTYIFLFDIIIGAILWPLIKRAVRSHDRKQHPHDGGSVTSESPRR